MKSYISLTIDLEWWGRAHLLGGKIPWGTKHNQDLESLEKILNILDEEKINATFFTVAEDFKKKDLIRLITAGHEIASHSINHPHFTNLSKRQWQYQIQYSKKLLEDQLGNEVLGFRTPSWSIPYERKDEFIDILAQNQYKYDSSFSAFPTKLYGDSRFSSQPEWLPQGILEIPLPILGYPKAPWVGGFYFRVAPLFLLQKVLKKSIAPFLYFHPWEFFADSSGNLSFVDSFIHNWNRMNNLNRFHKLIKYLKKEKTFCLMRDYLNFISR